MLSLIINPINTMTRKVFLYTLLFLFTISQVTQAQSFPHKLQLGNLKDPWTKNQLIQPDQLAALIKNPKAAKPLIFNIGVVEDIKGAKNMGAASEKENLERFQKAIQGLPKSTFLVVYCGCCPFDKCPNIRPAFQALKDSGFTRARLLNLAANIKVDWINKGYPLAR